MNIVTKDDYLNALSIIRQYRRQNGKMPVIQWIVENPGITVRLGHVLRHAASTPGCQFIEDLTEEKFFQLRNAERRSWEEFQDVLNPAADEHP